MFMYFCFWPHHPLFFAATAKTVDGGFPNSILADDADGNMTMQGQGSLLSTALPFAKLVAPEILWWPMDKSSRCRGRFGGSGGCNCPPTDRRIHQGFADFSCSQSWIFIGDLSVQLIDRTLYENSLRNYKQISPLLNFRNGNSNNFLNTKSHSPTQFAWFKPNTIKLDQGKNFGGQWWCWSVDIKQNIICRPFSIFQARFKDQFPDGIMIKKDGMESGLAKAETNAHEAKLFKVAGGSRPVMTEVALQWFFSRSETLQWWREFRIVSPPGGHGVVVDEPWRRVCARFWEEDLRLERIRSLNPGEDERRSDRSQVRSNLFVIL